MKRMPVYLQAGLLGLLFGPIAYCRISRFTRAAVSAGLIAVALLGFAYVHYLGVFAELNSCDMSAREATDTAIAATKIWLAGASTWAPGLVGLLLVLNVPCAIDAARLAAKAPSTPELEA